MENKTTKACWEIFATPRIMEDGNRYHTSAFFKCDVTGLAFSLCLSDFDDNGEKIDFFDALSDFSWVQNIMKTVIPICSKCEKKQDCVEWDPDKECYRNPWYIKS